MYSYRGHSNTIVLEPTIDAFGRSRVSQPATLFDSQHQYDDSPLFWNTQTSGGGTTTHLTNQSSVRLSCGTGTADFAIRQTKSYFRYQPGKSQLIFLTANVGQGTAGVTKRLGYFDANNGVFLEQAGTTLSWNIRSFVSGSAVTNSVAQSSWNIDKLDGSGNSKITLDMTKAQIAVMDMEWLGVGRVRCGFVIDGHIHYTHEFNHANTGTAVYMTTANLPVRYEIRNTAAQTGTASLIQICSSVISEGGFEEERGMIFSANMGTAATGVTTRRPVFSIRPGTAFAGQPNRGQYVPVEYHLMAQTNPCLIEIVYNGTLTGANFAGTVNATHSGMLFDTAGTAISGGVVVESFYIPASAGVSGRVTTTDILRNKLMLGLDIAGTAADTLSVVATSLNATSSISAGMSWRELK